MLEDEAFESFLLSLLKRSGEGVQKIAEKIHYLSWDAFVNDPLIFWTFIQKLRCLAIDLFLGLNTIILVLLVFKESLFVITHSTVSS